jgi:hypothetical protein
MLMQVFAIGTKVSVEKSRAELDTLLGKYGATARAIVVDDQQARAQVAFMLGGLKYRLDIPLPVRAMGEPPVLPRGWKVWSEFEREQWCLKQYDQTLRERWRVVVLLIRAKLEAVGLGLSTVEKEFIADLVLEDGRTVYTALGDNIRYALATNAPLSLVSGSRQPAMLGTGT